MEKSAGENAWNPVFVWNLLRRNRSYQQAIDKFYAAAMKARDTKAINVYKGILGRGPLARTLGTTNDKTHHLGGTLYMLEDPKLRDYLRSRVRVSEALNPSAMEKVIFDFDRTSTYFTEFLARFGDVVLFPVPYKTLDGKKYKPTVQAFRIFWVFYPGRIVEDGIVKFAKKARAGAWDPEDINASAYRVHYFNIAINESFSDDLIKQSIEAELALILERRKRDRPIVPSRNRLRICWEAEYFKECMKVWDLKEKYPNMDFRDIGANIWGGKMKKQKDPKRGLRDEAEQRYRRANKLISLFDR